MSQRGPNTVLQDSSKDKHKQANATPPSTSWRRWRAGNIPFLLQFVQLLPLLPLKLQPKEEKHVT